MGDEQLPRDVARPDSHHGELDYPAADVVGQGPSVHKYAAKLINSRLTYNFHNFARSVHLFILVFSNSKLEDQDTVWPGFKSYCYEIPNNLANLTSRL